MPPFSSPARGWQADCPETRGTVPLSFVSCSVRTCLLIQPHEGAECHYKGAPLQVPNEKHCWISETLLISVNETFCAGGLFSPQKQCCNHLKLLKIPKDRLVQSTIPASPWELKKCFTVTHLAKSAGGLYYVLLAFSSITYTHSTR